MIGLDGVAHFDWYSCSVPASIAKVRYELERETGGSWQEVRSRMPRYPKAVDLVGRGGERLCHVMWGASGNPNPHLIATSDEAAIMAEVFRECFPDHWVSRVDSAVDLCRDNLVYEIERVFLEVKAKYPRVKDDRQGPFAGIHPTRGTTFYLGSPDRFMVRGYEKAKQLIDIGQGERSLLACPETRGWCRVEAQWRPEKKPDKLRAAKASPLEVWGFAQFGIDLLQLVADLDAPVMDRKLAKAPDINRAEQWMFRQYSASIAAIADRCGGSPEAIGRYFLERIGALVDEAVAGSQGGG